MRSMRVLGRVRISRLTEDSTSIDRQRASITRWAEENGHDVVAWAEDIDLSGAVSPFEAPELGKYFTEPSMHDWDILVAWKLDRVARTSVGLHKVFGWIQENNKSLVCVQDNIDLSTWVGRLIASVIAGVAEGELEAIRQRAKASAKALASKGRWKGGTPPYGYRPIKLEQGWALELDPEEQEILQRIIRMFLDHTSTAKIAATLNEEGVLAPMQKRFGRATKGWSGAAIRATLRNRALLGWSVHDSVPIMDELGKPVMKGPPSVTMEVWEAIQNELQATSISKSGYNHGLLTGVLYCGACGDRMYIHRQTIQLKNGPIEYVAYECSGKCGAHMVREQRILEFLEEQVPTVLSGVKVRVRTPKPARDLSEELAETREAYNSISSFLASAPNEEARKAIFAQLQILGERIKKLETEDSSTQSRQGWVELEESYDQGWDSSDWEGKVALLRKSGITIRARALSKGTRHSPAIIEAELVVPEDLKERLNHQ